MSCEITGTLPAIFCQRNHWQHGQIATARPVDFGGFPRGLVAQFVRRWGSPATVPNHSGLMTPTMKQNYAQIDFAHGGRRPRYFTPVSGLQTHF